MSIRGLTKYELFLRGVRVCWGLSRDGHKVGPGFDKSYGFGGAAWQIT